MLYNNSISNKIQIEREKEMKIEIEIDDDVIELLKKDEMYEDEEYVDWIVSIEEQIEKIVKEMV